MRCLRVQLTGETEVGRWVYGGKNEDESMGTEQVGANLANYDLDELGLSSTLESCSQEATCCSKSRDVPGGHVIGALQRIMSTKQIS